MYILKDIFYGIKVSICKFGFELGDVFYRISDVRVCIDGSKLEVFNDVNKWKMLNIFYFC